MTDIQEIIKELRSAHREITGANVSACYVADVLEELEQESRDMREWAEDLLEQLQEDY